MAIQVSPNLPANVVEIGNEITQAKIDEINSGTVSTQQWVSINYAPKASPTFTGTVTIPAGASISGYLTTSSASSTYQTISGMSSYLTTASASATYAPKASPTFTGTVTIPAGASISGYLTTSSASATYQTQAGMTNYLTTSAASTLYQTISGMTSYLTTANAANVYASKFDPATGNYPAVYEAPSDGNEYVRKNAAWVVATGGGGGGGGLTISTLSNAATSTLNATAPTTGQALTFDGTDLVWATVGGGGGGGGGVAWGGITGTVTDQTDLTTYLSGNYYPLTGNPSGFLTSVPTKTVYSTGGTHTLVSGDENKVIFMNGGMNGNTLTVPADSTYAFPDGTEITVVCDLGSGTNQISGQYAGQPVFNGNSAWSVTITNPVGKLVKIATDTWYYY